MLATRQNGELTLNADDPLQLSRIIESIRMLKRIILTNLLLLTISCSTNKMLIMDPSASKNLVSVSVLDYSTTKAKKYPDRTIFFVHSDTLEGRIEVSITASSTKYIFRSETELNKKPFKGSIKEIRNQLYHFNDTVTPLKNDFELAINYGLIKLNPNTIRPYVDDFNDDLQKVMIYAFCEQDYTRNIKVYFNNWAEYKQALQKLECNK